MQTLLHNYVIDNHNDVSSKLNCVIQTLKRHLFIAKHSLFQNMLMFLKIFLLLIISQNKITLKKNYFNCYNFLSFVHFLT